MTDDFVPGQRVRHLGTVGYLLSVSADGLDATFVPEMSVESTVVETAALEDAPVEVEDVPCPVCEAFAGEPCRHLDHPAQTINPHAQRKAEAKAEAARQKALHDEPA